MGTGAWERERGDGSMGTAPWERRHGNALFLLSVSNKILHRTIQMIYFDGSVGTGGEWQGRDDHWDGSMWMGAWGWERGVGFSKYFTSYDSYDLFLREHGDGRVGKGAWELHCGNSTIGTAAIFYCLFQKKIKSYDSNDLFFYIEMKVWACKCFLLYD